VGDKWTLLIVRDLAAGPRRFVELQRTLPGISTEQLRSRLNRMVADGLLTRKRYREVPPRVDYELTERSKELMPVIGALAQWGYDWTWSAPRRGERVDIGAILRCTPGMLSPGLAGTIDCLVTDENRHYVLTASTDGVEISEKPPEQADATVSGTRADWVEALGPDGSVKALEVSGPRPLVDAVLGRLEEAASERRAA
jgi:DNA-binding HxlR family transcriptional regulator